MTKILDEKNPVQSDSSDFVTFGKDKTSKLEFILKGYHFAYATRTQKFLYCYLTH